MNVDSALLDAPPIPSAPRRAAVRRRPSRDGWIYLAMGLLTALAWWVTTLKLFTPGSDAGYWLGVVGGVTMLLVFAYPMRKHLRVMQRWGAGKHWFVLHMCVGVVGPVIILAHSTFTIGSINAGVALVSMLVVAASGVVGRFLYVRVHQDLHGQRLNLAELRQAIHGEASALQRLEQAPQVQQALLDFEAASLRAQGRVGSLLWGALGLWWLRLRTERRCRALLKTSLAAQGRTQAWSRTEQRRQRRAARTLVHTYLDMVQRIAQYAAWDRLFALWHVAHVPFVYMMVLSAVAHVVAVHVY